MAINIGSALMGMLDIIAGITIIVGLGFNVFTIIITALLFIKGTISLI